MTTKSLALAAAMTAMLGSATAYGQTTHSHLVSPALAAPRAEGHATNTTDRAGLRNTPSATVKIRAPQHVPGWHIPLPHLHKGR